jgi:glutaredoxin-related protein
MTIFIYTKSGCPNCVAAKKLLKEKGLRFIENDMDKANVRQAFNFAYPDVRGMPQIFVNDIRIGGLLGLQSAFKELGL